MMTVRAVLLTVLILGSLILIHETGHFVMARIFHVGINEFSLGMGPKLFSKKSKKSGTVYSLRLLPIGGYVSMEGEDEFSVRPDAFCHKKVWQRMLITFAGPFMNVLIGFLAMIVMVLGIGAVSTTIVSNFSDDAVSNADGFLSEKDRILEIDGKTMHTRTEVLYAVLFGHFETQNMTVQKNGEEVVLENAACLDITVERNGEVVELKNVPFRTETSEGVLACVPDFGIYFQKMTFGGVIRQAFFDAGATIRMIWQTFADLLRGHYGISAMSGPIGVGSAIGSVERHDYLSLLYMFILISMNLGIFNLIPFPPLDGGRILFLAIEAIIRKPLNKNVESAIQLAGFVIMFGLIILVSGMDIFKLFK